MELEALLGVRLDALMTQSRPGLAVGGMYEPSTAVATLGCCNSPPPGTINADLVRELSHALFMYVPVCDAMETRTRSFVFNVLLNLCSVNGSDGADPLEVCQGTG